MRLSELVKSLLSYTGQLERDPEILDIQVDSRRVGPGTLFVAVPGFTVDGHDFAQGAVESGAVALLVERPITDVDVPQIIVADTRRASAILADVLYAHPSRALRTIGVTGTNGKTTVTHIVRHILEYAGKRTGVMGTVGAVIGSETIPLANTTPEAVDVHGYLHRMALAGLSHAVMEVSSHALVGRRVAGVDYKIAVFTNLSQDHLDFHKTMDAYAQAKSLFFARLGNTFANSVADGVFAVVNGDDAYANVMLDATVAQSLTYGLGEHVDVQARDVHLTHRGAEFTVSSPFGTFTLKTALIGRFNVYNALAAVSVALLEGVSTLTIAEALATYQGVPGRCERIDEGQPYGIFVDYAHTPDGLANVLSSVREFAKSRVITVVGCGGDRDKTKRPIMAQTALQYSDLSIFTSDNPRTEAPESILDDMEEGIDSSSLGYLRIADRKTAIQTAISHAKENDVVVIAGKGHEDYQIIGRTKIHFDDREEARTAVRTRRGQ